MITVSKFILDENGRESLELESDPLQYICYCMEYDPGHCLSWHWHPAFEIDYVAEGSCEFKNPECVLELTKGDAVFVNSNALHEIHINGLGHCRVYTHLFDMHFLSGMYNSVFEQKYVDPILENRQLDLFLLRSDHSRGVRMMECIISMIELADKEPFGYEFMVRSELSRFWCLFAEETKDLRQEVSASRQTDIERIKLMMEYIGVHHSEKVSLADIAASANVSTRECTRCFRRCTGLSPVEYLNQLRIRMAAQALLQTDDSILAVSENCGFSSGSYFGRVFSEAMGCTPGQYRRRYTRS